MASSNSEENKGDVLDCPKRIGTYDRKEGDIVHDGQYSVLKKMDLHYELNRLKSFVKWSPFHPLKPNVLAKNGFYHKGPGDNVSCVFCKNELRKWKANDNIEERHLTISPNCPFLRDKNIDNEPIPAKREILLHRPMHPKLALSSERLKTFATWSKDNKKKPEDLAEAGFFHNGKSDTVICYSCDGGLCNWEEEDIPWQEHAQWYPRCTFVQMKFSKFNASDIMKSAESSDSQDSYRQDDAEKKAERNAEKLQDITTFPNTPELGKGAILPTNRNLNSTLSCLNTPTVQAVLYYGYNENIVKRVVRNKIKETGSSFSKASLLLEAIHNCPDFKEDVEEVSDEEESQARTDANTNTKSVAGAALVEDNIMLKQLKLCKICLDEELSTVFVPCGHLVTCASCGLALSKCPVCEKEIHGRIKAYF